MRVVSSLSFSFSLSFLFFSFSFFPRSSHPFSFSFLSSRLATHINFLSERLLRLETTAGHGPGGPTSASPTEQRACTRASAYHVSFSVKLFHHHHHQQQHHHCHPSSSFSVTNTKPILLANAEVRINFFHFDRCPKNPHGASLNFLFGFVVFDI